MNTTVEERIGVYPYPGLRPFRQEESDIFFGRDRQVDELLANLEDNRFLAVIGPSGCGKSSLVRAGLIPALEVGYMASAGFRWHVAQMRPGDQPTQRLAKALLESSAFETNSAVNDEDVAFMRATLRRGPLGLIELLNESPIASGHNLLLLVDQFEEIFRFERQSDRDEARSFVDLLLTTVESPDVRVYVVITMRSDFLGSCPVFVGLPEAMNDSQFLTPRLTREQQQTAIECPLAQFNAHIEPAVVSRILNEMGTDPDQLPLMQHLLMRMWRGTVRHRKSEGLSGEVTLTMEDYDKAGGLKGALRSHAQRTFDNLGGTRRKAIAERIFRNLTEVTDDGHTVRRPAKLDDLCDAVDADEEDLISVINEFRLEGRSFLMPSMLDELRPSVVDISHESLIRQWDTLREWTDDESTAQRVAKMVHSETSIWEAKGRDKPNDHRYLLMGVRLEEALQWADEHRVELESGAYALVREFLDRSKAHREELVRKDEEAKYAQTLAEKNQALEELNKRQRRTNRRLRVAWAVALVFAVVAACLAVWANGRRGEAEAQTEIARIEKEKADGLRDDADASRMAAVDSRREALDQRKVAEVQRLVAVGRNHKGAETKLLLATEAVRAKTRIEQPPAPEALDLFRDALGEFNHSGITSEVIGRHESPITAFQVRDDRWVASGSADGSAYLWDLQANDASSGRRALEGHHSAVTVMKVDRNHKWIATGTVDGVFRLWRFPEGEAEEQWTGRPQFVLMDHQGGKNHQISDIEFSRSGEWVVTSDSAGNARRWDLKLSDDGTTPPKSQLLTGHSNGITDILITSDSQRLITGSRDNSARVWELAAPDPSNSKILSGHTNWIWDVTVTPDSTATEPATKLLATASDDATVRIWDLNNLAATPKVLRDGQSQYGMRVATFSPDNRWLATGDANGMIRLWNMLLPDLVNQTPYPRRHASYEMKTSYRIKALRFSPDSKWLVSAIDESSAHLWQVTARGPAARPVILQGHETDSGTPNLLRYDPEALGQGVGGAGGVLQLGFAGEGKDGERSKTKWLFTAGTDGAIRRWDLTGENSVIRNTFVHTMNRAVFSPDNRWVVNEYYGRGKNWYVNLWDCREDSEARRFEFKLLLNGPVPIRRIVFSGDSNWLAITDEKNVIWLWDVSGDDPSHIGRRLIGHSEPISCFSFSPDNRWLVSGSEDSTTRLWDLASRKPIILKDHTRPIECLAMSPNNHWLATGSQDQTVRLWDLSASEPSTTSIELRGHGGATRCLAFSPDSRVLATGGNDNTVRLWSGLDGGKPSEQGQELHGHTQPIEHLEISSDSQWLATGSRDKTVRIWDLSDEELATERFVLRHEDQIQSLIFSSDSNWLITGSDDNTCRVWDLEADDPSERPLLLHGYHDAEKSLAIDRHRLLAGKDGVVHLLDLRAMRGEAAGRMQPLKKFYGHVGQFLAVDFSGEDGFVTSGADGTVRRWDLTASEVFEDDTIVRRAVQSVGRNLTTGEWREYLANEDYRPNLDLPVASFESSTKEEEARRTHRINLDYGRRFARNGEIDKAIEQFEIAKRWIPYGFDPQKEANRLWADAIVQRAYELAAGLDIDSAVERFRRAQEISESMQLRLFSTDFDPQTEVVQHATQVLIEQANHYVNEGKAAVAVAAYLDIQEQVPGTDFDPKHQASLILDYANTKIQQGQTDYSVELLQMVKELDPGFTFDPHEYMSHVQGRALVDTARNLAAQGDTAGATTQLTEAKKLDPKLDYDPAVFAQRLAVPVLIDRGKQFAQQGQVEEAVRAFEEAKQADAELDFDARSFATRLAADKLIREFAPVGKVREALDLYKNVQTSGDPSLRISAQAFNAIAWYGCLTGHIDEVKTFADRAVSLDATNASYRDTRGLVRAYSGGELDDIVNDFQAYVTWHNSDPVMRGERQGWIEELRGGRAVKELFNDDLLKSLRERAISKGLLQDWKQPEPKPETTTR